jgi:hypothetical protein
MKLKIVPLTFVIAAASGLLKAQDNGPQNFGPPPPPPGEQGPAGFRAHVLPPGARERLNLTADQLRQVAALEEEVKARLETILTPAQIQQLQQMRPPRPRGGPGGPGADNPPPPPAE